MAHDPFDEVFDLENQFFREGYKQGHDDGVKAGRAEGRSLGLERGFAKFVEAGRLQGRAVVWASRLRPAGAKGGASSSSRDSASAGTRGDAGDGQREAKLPGLSSNPKLEKNVAALYALVEPDTLSTENTDEAVADFDDRLKRAQGKARVIVRAVGEPTELFRVQDAGGGPGHGDGSIEDTAPGQTHSAQAA
jgi:hypothetical protein